MTRPYARCWPANGRVFSIEMQEGHEFKNRTHRAAAVVPNSNRRSALCATSGSDVCDVVLQNPGVQASFGTGCLGPRGRRENWLPGWGATGFCNAGLTAQISLV